MHSKLPSAHKINHLVQILRVHLRLVVRVAGRLRRTLSENVAPQRGATTAFLGTTETLTESIKRSGSTQTNVASSLRAHLPRKCVTPYLKDGTFLEDIDIRLFLRVPLHKKSRRRADALAGSCASSLGDSRRPRRRGTPGARSQRVRASKTSPKILQNNKVFLSGSFPPKRRRNRASTVTEEEVPISEPFSHLNASILKSSEHL